MSKLLSTQIMKIIKILFSVLICGFVIFILWMNLTPGHFQYRACTCGEIGYISTKVNEKMQTTCGIIFGCFVPSGRLMPAFLLNLAKIDFNK